MQSLLDFYKAVAEDDDYDCGAPRYEWIVERLHDEWMDETFGPILGPPLPRGDFDKMLMSIYGPAIRKQINDAKPFWRQLGVHGVD